MFQELAETYSRLSDEQLLVLASEEEQLTPEALEILRAELGRRNINDQSVSQIQAHRTRELEREKLRAIDRAAGRSGRRYCGKSNLQIFRSGKVREYDSTLFVTVLYLPAVPLGTYRVREFRSDNWFRRRHRVLAKLKLDWEQVLGTWVVSAAIAFAALLILRFAVHLVLR